MRKQWMGTLAAIVCAKAAFAQTVRGTVVADGARPTSGVVVLLIDPASKEVGRALTNERGEYRLTAPRPGSYRLRTMRIGFQSLVTEPFVLVAGDDMQRALSVSAAAFALDTVRATGRNTCRVVAADSTSVVAAIWEQVRSALIATQLTLATRTIYSTSLAYERMLDIRSQKIGTQMMDVRGEFVRQPWRSLTIDSLRKVGYVYTLADSSRVYNAPDLAVLISDEFTEDHCFRIASASNEARLGVEFSPTPQRRNTPDVRGTVWLDRRTNELIEMEFGYINRIRSDEERNAGGIIGFARMRNGMWAISRWSIRMPSWVMAPIYSPSYALLRHEARLDSIKVTGGELVMATTTGGRRDTLWVRPRASLRGIVVDSLSGAPVRRAIVTLAGTVQLDTTGADGRFAINGVLPGRYTVQVSTPSLDSVNTVDQRSVLFADTSMALSLRVANAAMIAGSVCGRSNTATRLGSGIILGSVARRGDSLPVANAAITAQWTEQIIGGAQTVRNEIREVTTRTDARGVFRVCGIPVGTYVAFHAKTDSGEAEPLRVRLAEGQLFARADLVVSRPRLTDATFAGVVVDSAGNSLADTEVQLSNVGLSTRTSATGAFRIAGVLPGSHTLIVRKPGYGVLDARIDLAAGETTDRRIVLTRVTVLDSMSVTARSFKDPNMDEFEERRRIGRGHFITNAEIVKREGSVTASFLGQMPSLAVHNAQGGDYPMGTAPKRCTESAPDLRSIANARPWKEPTSLCEVFYVPGTEEARRGVAVACYSKVYVDNQLMNPGKPTPPFNLRDFPPTQIEAIEYYSRPAELPAKISDLNSACGVIIIHTRRPK